MKLKFIYIIKRGTQWCSWSRHCVTSQKVVGSILRWCHLDFPSTQSFQPHYEPGVDSACDRNEYQGYFLGAKGSQCMGLTMFPPSCANCLEIWEPEPPGMLRTCPGLYRDCFTFCFFVIKTKTGNDLH